MNLRNRMIVVASVLLALSACSAEQDEGRRVAASGKEDLALEALPEEVRSAALAASPGFSITAVEYETRDGNEYYDVGGTFAGGSERELDKHEVKWTDGTAELLVDEWVH